MEQLITSLVHTEHKNLFTKVKEKSPDPRFVDEFHAQLDRIVLLHTGPIPPGPDFGTLEEHEGNFGVLPSPARRQVVRDVLSGLPISPLKIAQEQQKDDGSQKKLDTLNFHMILEVTPSTGANVKEIALARTSIGLIAQKTRALAENPIWTFKSSSTTPIRVQQVGAVVHLIQRNALGQYTVSDLDISTSDREEEALTEYEKAVNTVNESTATGSSSDDLIAHELAFARIAAQMEKESGERQVALPIVVSHKFYSYQNKWGYEGLRNELKQLTGKSTPFDPVRAKHRAHLGADHLWTIVRDKPFFNIEVDRWGDLDIPSLKKLKPYDLPRQGYHMDRF